MANRHKKQHKATGGIATAGGNPEIIKEAEEKKKGGKAMGKMHGPLSRHRLDRPGRKTGGRVGADKSPLSSANSSSSPPGAPKSNSST